MPSILNQILIKKDSLYVIHLLIFVGMSISLSGQNADLQERLRTHTEILASDSLEGRGVGAEKANAVKEYIINEFKNVGIEPYMGEYEYPFSIRVQLIRATGTNIIGMIEGSDPILKNEFIVLGAHYDHVGYKMVNAEKVIYNGADDNASGVATIIELAREINNQDIQLKRSLIFVAFDGEESGLLGSKHFVNDTALFPEQVKFMFSVDMVGMYTKNGGLDLAGILSIAEGEELLASSLNERNISITKTNAKIEQRTDTKPFGDAGIPASHAFTGLKSPYHKPEDKSDLLDYEGMAEVTEFMTTLTTNLANTESLTPIPNIGRGAESISKNKKNIQFGVKTDIGSYYHKYSNEFYRSNSGFSGQFGFFSAIYITQSIILQPEVLYGTNGTSHTDGEYRSHALTIPVNIQLSTPEFSSSRVYLFGGAYYSYNFSGKVGGEATNFNDNFAQENWGISAGIGAEVMKVTVGYTYKHGLTNINTSATPGEIVERGSYLTLGLTF